MIREGYTDLINYVANITGKSYNMAWQVVKEYSTVIKEAIKRGDTVNVEGLVTITFTTKEGIVYKNREYNLDDQVDDLHENLGINKIEVKTILVNYLKRMRERVLDGYQVNLKGVCYLKPEKRDGFCECIPRVSPVLESPELADFLITSEDGIYLIELEDADLRFRIEVDEGIEFIERKASKDKDKLELREVDI